MSSSQSTTQPISHDSYAPGHSGARRDSTDPEVIHHLYFEDNDSFFPPSWVGKEGERRPSTDSVTSQEPKAEPNTTASPEHAG
ncbi:hypothetical protein N7478_006768 [Penicillium angulare]|uniref:uncharacterized protein n=1 Tax=Penicillium angulare TaxID=116970 RepID=UPI002541AC84|nr:uncharacterized protein N7478_006768 [Penicillium angulare]KAJ5281396.1 hypothetical protein N7478_006768 [Penicillium angulare]